MTRRREFLHANLIAAATALCGWRTVLGQQSGLSDLQLRAAYLLNFLRYVDWPERIFPTPEAPLTLCVLGADTATSLAGITGRLAKGRPVAVRAVGSLDEARACHAIYFPEQDTRRYVGLMRGLQNAPVLTVGDADGFVDIGGMIGLVQSDNRLQFEVNLGTMALAQLRASSQLLRLARNVVEGRPR